MEPDRPFDALTMSNPSYQRARYRRRHQKRHTRRRPGDLRPKDFRLSERGPRGRAVRSTLYEIRRFLGLPGMLRLTSDLEAKRRQAWWIAYQNYRQCLARMTLHYHEAEKLQITAAQLKAETETGVINAMVESRRLWEAWQIARRGRINLKAELRARRLSGLTAHPGNDSA